MKIKSFITTGLLVLLLIFLIVRFIKMKSSERIPEVPDITTAMVEAQQSGITTISLKNMDTLLTTYTGQCVKRLPSIKALKRNSRSVKSFFSSGYKDWEDISRRSLGFVWDVQNRAFIRRSQGIGLMHIMPPVPPRIGINAFPPLDTRGTYSIFSVRSDSCMKLDKREGY